MFRFTLLFLIAFSYPAPFAFADTSSGQRDPNLYDLDNNASQLIFTCHEPVCSYYDEETQLDIPLLKNWAIMQPDFYQTAGGTRAKVPSIEYVDTQSGLWIRQNPRQIQQVPTFVICDDFSYKINGIAYNELLCLSQARVSKQSRKQGEALIKTIKQWRLQGAKKRDHEARALARKGLKRYTGNYFSVLYPQDFSAKPSLKEAQDTIRANTDEATFISPDNAVEFFIYSPLWTGQPKNYLKRAKGETLVSKDSKMAFRKDKYRNNILTTWKTFKAKDGSYQRSLVIEHACHDDGKSRFSDCTSKVFGIKYKNQKAYQQYKVAYLKFKRSLEQYAD